MYGRQREWLGRTPRAGLRALWRVLPVAVVLVWVLPGLASATRAKPRPRLVGSIAGALGRLGRPVLLVLCLVLGSMAVTPRVPAAHASQTLNLTNTEIQITSDASTFSTGEINEYGCTPSYPHFVNWKDNSSGGTDFTYSQWSNGGSGSSADPDWVKVHFGAIGTASDGIVYRCSSQWPPTTADCGGEGQPDCWGAVQGYAPGTPKQGWMQPDEMFYAGGSGLCDHSLIGGTDYVCKSSGRHQLTSTSWENWALDNQRYGISGQEPINWYTTLGTHNSFNTSADSYIFPNQGYSISDQLTDGARALDLRARWICCTPYYEKLSVTTGNDSTSGAAPSDRAYTYAIEEIGAWLRSNPTQVILLDIGIGTGGAAAPDQSYLYDPVDTYLNSMVLTPAAWCNYLHTNFPNVARPYAGSGISESNCAGIGTSGTYIPYRWPTTDEMRTLGKQVIIITNGGALGEGYAFDNLSDSGNDMDSSAGYGNDLAKDFASSPTIDPTDNSDATSCTRNGVPYLYNSDATAQQRDFYNRVWTTEGEDRSWLEVELGASDWPGYLVATAADVAAVSQVKFPGSTQAAAIEPMVNCNVSLINLDNFGADNTFWSEQENVTQASIGPLTDRRDVAIWSWANGDTGTGGDCAVLGATDNKWHSRPCTEVHHFACALPRTGDPTTWPDVLQDNWRITQGTGTWYQGGQLCHQEFGSTAIVIGSNTYTGLVFSSPRNGRADQELIAERGRENLDTEDLWLAYANSGGAWHTGASPALQVTATAGGKPYTFGSWTNHDVTVTANAASWADVTTAGATITYCKTGAETGCGSLSTAGTITISQEGITYFAVQATDAKGNASPLTRFAVQIDTTPPFSAIVHSGPIYAKGPSGERPFVTSATRFTVGGADEGSGVAGFAYRAYPLSSAAPPYTQVPSSGFTFTLGGADGPYSLSSYATDNAGNTESPHGSTVILDNTAPIVTVAQPNRGVYTHSDILTLRYLVSDGHGSGVRGYTPLLDGVASIDGRSLVSGQRINLLTALPLGRHTFTIWQATDNVGNSRTVKIPFTIIVTPTSMPAEAAAFLRLGAIANASWEQAIATQLNAAARARAAGQCSAANAIYTGAMRAIAGHEGNWITTQAGNVLNTDLRYLIAHCS